MELLYRQYASRVYSLSLRLLGDVPAAEEATMTVFVKLARLLYQQASPTDIENFLIRITVDVALRQFGGSARKFPTAFEVESDRRKRLQGPLDRQTLNVAALESAINGLPVDLRFAFVLHDIERLSHEEIADLLGWPVGRSKVSLARARLELHSLLLNNGQLAAVGEHPRQSKGGK